MIEQAIAWHHIQKHILSVLARQEFARFRDLRPPKTDTNLFSYHLKILIKQGFITKSESGYTLSHMGLAYVDRISTKKFTVRTQPKIITMTCIEDDDGRVLLQQRDKQPYINAWTLPYGKIHDDDNSIIDAASREICEKAGLMVKSPRHVGDCYIRVRLEDDIVLTTLAHIFHARVSSGDAIGKWWSVSDISNSQLAPAVLEIVDIVAKSESHFFAEFALDWYN